jgi:3-dehydroquinate synthase
VLGDAEFFTWLEVHGHQVIAGEEPFLTHAVTRSVAAKAAIVAEDERETTGCRALLNLGHTFGHALEAETGFSGRLLHGEAVALGMVLAARYSARRGELTKAAADRIAAAVAAAGLPSSLAALHLGTDGATLVVHMRNDKKAAGGTLPFILLRSVGEAWLAKDVDLRDVAAFLDQQLRLG